eukprot:scaffold6442_cov73-Skeletonema_marinoi.AAC.12
MVGMQGGDGLVGSISNMNVVRYTSVLLCWWFMYVCLFDALLLPFRRPFAGLSSGRTAESERENRVWASSSRERR